MKKSLRSLNNVPIANFIPQLMTFSLDKKSQHLSYANHNGDDAHYYDDTHKSVHNIIIL